LKSEEKEMQSNIDFGNSLLQSGEISNAQNKDKLQNEIDDISLRKSQLNKHFSDGNVR